MPQTEDYLILIGAMKAGTTTLFAELARHPQIAPASPKEPGFFAFEEVHAQGFEWYHGLFDFDPARHRYRMAASTDYTKAPFVTGVRERMARRENARYKFVYILRDPLDRIESHARHVQLTRREIGRDVSPSSDHSLDSGISPVSLAISSYAWQIEPYREDHVRGNLHITTLERLTEDTRAVMEELWSFLELEPISADRPLDHRNPAGGPPKPGALLKAVIQIRPLLAAGKLLLPKSLRARLKTSLSGQTALKGRFDLTEPEKQALAPLFAADLAQLATDYGVEFLDTPVPDGAPSDAKRL